MEITRAARSDAEGRRERWRSPAFLRYFETVPRAALDQIEELITSGSLIAFALLALLVLPAAPSRADSISAFCESRGNALVTEQNPNGSKTIYCVLKDGTRMNAVAYFRNQHRTR